MNVNDHIMLFIGSKNLNNSFSINLEAEFPVS